MSNKNFTTTTNISDQVNVTKDKGVMSWHWGLKRKTKPEGIRLS